MQTVALANGPPEVAIPEEYRETAMRYIEAIARRDATAHLGPTSVAERTGELWQQFVANYTAVRNGPYARHGQDAVRIALGRL